MLVEAKLWRNPEARRSVIAQALEYASALFNMTYEDLESAVRKARLAMKMSDSKITEIVASATDGLHEEEFIDALSHNLERGRAIVVVVGDGIREDIVPLAGLLQSHAGHRFTFALVELAVYETPITGARLVIPSVLAQTVLLERGVVRIADAPQGPRVIVELSTQEALKTSPTRRMTTTEDEFFEILGQRYPGLPEALKSFLSKAAHFGVYADLQGGLNLKHAAKKGNPLNMASIQKDGIVDTDPSVWWSTKPAARAYNAKLAELVGGIVAERKEGLHFAVRTQEGRMPRLSSLLPEHEEEWLLVMERYIQANLLYRL